VIDSHCHLDDPKLGDEPIEVLARARAAGIRAMIAAGVDLPSSRSLVAIAEEHEAVYVAVGFHPHEAIKFRDQDAGELRRLAEHPKVVAIGEIGLDYHFDHSPREVQRDVFVRQLTLAADIGLPVVIHNRDAQDDMYPFLAEWAAYARNLPEIGMLHCFSEDLPAAEQYVDLGFHLSIACPVTYPNAQNTRDVVAGIPLYRLLTETDSPYLPPQNLRGKRNEPANVAAVVDKIAEIKGYESTFVAEQTAGNAIRLFALPIPAHVGLT